jgi:uncharacterized protein YdeI (YjbR/CyaY-like superfamily)
MEDKVNLPVISFQSAKEWRTWLSKNSQTADGVWLKIFKKGSKEKTITYAEALEESLCYGWIQADSILGFLQGDFPQYASEAVNTLNEIGATNSAEIIKQAVELLQEDGSWFLKKLTKIQKKQ